MVEFISAIIIAIVQGLTEWIPISSSGHLVLVENLLGFAGGLFFDVALHFGTLMAVVVYFGQEIVFILEDILNGRWKTRNARLFGLLVIASIPAAIVGFLFKKYFEVAFSSLGIVALGFGITGIVLLISGLGYGKKKGKLGKKEAFLIGCVQVISLFPGISRSGTTMSSGILLGLKEKEAVKFSFLMSIPIIFGANILSLGSSTLPPEFIWSTFVSFIVGLGTIHVLYKYVLVERKNLRWFGIYCLLLALVIGLVLLI